MKIIKIIFFLTILVFSAQKLYSQNDSLSVEDKVISLIESNEVKRIQVEYKILLNSEKEKTAKQKKYKILFFILFLVVLLASSFILILFFQKLRQNSKIIKIQDREIELLKNKKE